MKRGKSGPEKCGKARVVVGRAWRGNSRNPGPAVKISASAFQSLTPFLYLSNSFPLELGL